MVYLASIVTLLELVEVAGRILRLRISLTSFHAYVDDFFCGLEILLHLSLLLRRLMLLASVRLRIPAMAKTDGRRGNDHPGKQKGSHVCLHRYSATLRIERQLPHQQKRPRVAPRTPTALRPSIAIVRQCTATEPAVQLSAWRKFASPHKRKRLTQLNAT